MYITYTCIIYHYHNIVLRLDSSEDTCKCDREDLSAGAAAGIAVTVTLLLVLPAGVIMGLGVALYGMRRGRGATSEDGQQKSQQLQEAIYEEPPETAISLRDNQAYGHLDIQRNN